MELPALDPRSPTPSLAGRIIKASSCFLLCAEQLEEDTTASPLAPWQLQEKSLARKGPPPQPCRSVRTDGDDVDQVLGECLAPPKPSPRLREA